MKLAYYYPSEDMGCGEVDDSLMMETEIPSINTTNHILDQIDDVDFVMHIGDISYAQGYSSVVSPRCTLLHGRLYVLAFYSMYCVVGVMIVLPMIILCVHACTCSGMCSLIKLLP